MSNDELIAILNSLIETCKDGQEGYRSAAESIQNSEFKRLFNIFSQQRAQFVAELEVEVNRLGGDAVSHGTLSGWLHRGWTNAKAAISGGDEASIVEECQKGDEAALQNF